MRKPSNALMSACLIGGAVVAVSLPAAAYVRTKTEELKLPMAWTDTDIDLRVYVKSPPDGLTSDQVFAASQEAAAVWSSGAIGCTAVNLLATAVNEESAVVKPDRVNRVMFRRSGWTLCGSDGKPTKDGSGACFDSQALAITSVWADTKTGQIVDADVEVNADSTLRVPFVWATLSQPRTGETRQDLQNVLTHEFGHVIGLDHNCVFDPNQVSIDNTGARAPSCSFPVPPPEITGATMYASARAGDIDKRTLSDDDIKAACEVYPASEPTKGGVVSTGGLNTGGCSMGGNVAASTPGLAGWIFGALGLATLGARRLRKPKRTG